MVLRISKLYQKSSVLEGSAMISKEVSVPDLLVENTPSDKHQDMKSFIDERNFQREQFLSICQLFQLL